MERRVPAAAQAAVLAALFFCDQHVNRGTTGVIQTIGIDGRHAGRPRCRERCTVLRCRIPATRRLLPVLVVVDQADH
ncbi:hypothetical protein ACFS4T_15495 [Pseudomonas lini]